MIHYSQYLEIIFVDVNLTRNGSATTRNQR